MSRRFRSFAAVAAAGLMFHTLAAARADDSLDKQNLVPTPDMQAVLDELQREPGKPITDLGALDARKQPSAASAAAAIMKEKGIDAGSINALEYEKDIKIDTPNGNLPARVYYPGNSSNTPLPVIVYYHGGGFVMATIDSYEQSARALAKGANAIVFAIEYRKAPEYKFPAAYDDAVWSYKWALEHAGDYKGDPKRIAVAGESAGGNLAAGVSQAARDQKFQLPTFQLLIYPWLNTDLKMQSYITNSMAKPLNTEMIKWFTALYAVEGPNLDDPKAFPGKATDLSGLPPAMVITASIDPLNSEGEAYAMALKKAGVPVEYKNYPGVTHEFFGLAAIVKTAKQAEDDAAAALRKAFSTTGNSAM